MTAQGVVVAAGGGYRVAFGGTVSAPVPALKSAYRLKIDFAAKTWEEQPPQVGDTVLCWFPGAAYVDGCIVGILEG